MTLPTIQVLYSCGLCGLKKVSVEVTARMTEDVVQWLEGAAVNAIAKDHRARSPFCTATTISDIMIPMTGASKVGGVSEH